MPEARDGNAPFYREAALSLVKPDSEGDDALELALSSEAPVERMDWMTGERFLEVLDHSKEAVDMSYARDGLPLLVDHSPWEQVGIVDDFRVDSDRVTRGSPRFSRSARGQEIEQDVRDGIRKKVSIGYRVLEWQKETRKGKGLPIWRAVRWMPVEGSMVAIPADYAVGVGRSADGAAPSGDDPPNTAPKAEERTMAEPATAATGDGATKETKVEVRSNANDAEMRDLAALAEMHALDSVFSSGVRDGKDTGAIRADMVKAIRERVKNGPDFKAPVTLTEKEEKRYSLTRALMSSAYGTPSFEREIHEQIAKNLPEGYKQQGGFFYPTNIRHFVPAGRDPLLPTLNRQTRSGLDSATATAGAEVVFDVPGSFIDMLRNKSRVIQLGATVLAGLSSPVTFAKQTGAGTASWVAENPTADVSVSAIATGTVTLTPKTLQSQTKFSKQLLKQQSYDVENIVRNDLAAIHALAIDLAAINGAGASNEPLGILQNTSINSVTVGTNGGVPTYALLVDMETAVEDDNADLGAMGYLTTPGIKGKLKKTEVFATTNGQPVWTGGQEGSVNGYRAYSSNQVPKNLTKGTSTTVCHAILFGSWPQLLIGEWGAAEFLTDPYTLAGSGMIRVVTFQMADIALRYAEAFCAIKDAKTA